jgi:chemotaxis methyl-accepting protein methylase
MFRIQVFGTDVDESVVEEARNITHNQSRKVRTLLSPQINELTFDQNASIFKNLALTSGLF